MRPIQARISIGAMAHNLRVVRSHAGTARVFAVVKANAYGHGLSRARRALAAADGFAVLTLEEAANLRLMGVEQPILLLEGLFGADEIATCAELDLWPVLHQAAHLDWLQQQPPARPLQVFLKFDSGMHRLGFPLAEHAAIVARTKSLAGVAGNGQRELAQCYLDAYQRAGGPEVALSDFLEETGLRVQPLELAEIYERIIPGALSMDHGARADLINVGPDGFFDRGGANNLISPVNGISQNCWGMATSGSIFERSISITCLYCAFLSAASFL